MEAAGRCCARGSGPESAGGPCCGRRRHGGGASRGGLVEPAVLAVLLRSDGHGYDLRREIVELTSGRVDVDPGGLYRTLRCLEEDGFVTSVWVNGTAGPQRREYRLTGEGRTLAQDWAAQLRERAAMSELLTDALSEAPERRKEGVVRDAPVARERKSK